MANEEKKKYPYMYGVEMMLGYCMERISDMGAEKRAFVSDLNTWVFDKKVEYISKRQLDYLRDIYYSMRGKRKKREHQYSEKSEWTKIRTKQVILFSGISPYHQCMYYGARTCYPKKGQHRDCKKCIERQKWA